MYLYIPVQLCSLVNTFNNKCICISLWSSDHWSIPLITNVSVYIPVQLYGEESVVPAIPHSHLCTVWKLSWNLSDIELTLWSESSISLKCQWKYFNRYSLIFKWMISEIILQWYFIDFFILFFQPNSKLSMNIYWNFNK